MTISRIAVPYVLLLASVPAAADWKRVYSQPFDGLPTGTKTTSRALPDWEGGSALGIVFDGNSTTAGKFLIAASAWTSFNQGPILNVDLTAVPHDRVRVRFQLFTFGDWRGLQQASGGPQHRLMFFDNKATPAFSFDTNFATNPAFQQSWPARNPARSRPLSGGEPANVDTTGRFRNAHRWLVEFEYPSDSASQRFAILCGAATGSGKPMPPFAIDDVQVSVRSTAPTILPLDRAEDIRLANAQPPALHGSRVEFRLAGAGRTSVGVYKRGSQKLVRTLLRGERLAPGTHVVHWDGRDNRGLTVPAGEYEWRRLWTPGLTAKYLTTIGINPPGGENPLPKRSWVGDHNGAGIVDVDASGIYVGSPVTEGMMMLAKIDSAKSHIQWIRPQFYQSGRLTRAASSGTHVYMLHPNGKLRRLDKNSGRVDAEWQVEQGDKAPSDMDAHDKNLVVVDQEQGQIRWLSTESGQTIATVSIANPVSVAAIGSGQQGAAAVASGRDLYVVRPDQVARKVAKLDAAIGAMDYDPSRKELWIVVDGHQVVRLDERFRIAQTYGDTPRPLGPFDPTRFAGVYDIAAGLNGGFYIGEPTHPPRRVAHLARDGSLIGQWFGGMSFYVGGTFDPDDPTLLYGIAPEGSVNVYRIDYDTGSWKIEACYATGRLGDGMFPFAGAFKAVRRNGQLYLYHRVLPAVLRLDPQLGRAIPVAIAGRVINHGRTFFQFAGSGRDGFPKPWVGGAEHHGYEDLQQAPELYSWADTNGNREFDPDEFRFYPNAKRGLSFHNPGDFTSHGDYVGCANTNEPYALLRLPVVGWEGPHQAAPRWDWDELEATGEIIANSYGYGSPRGVSVGPDDSISVAYQAGIMIRDHGQYEGGGWPEAGLRGARLLGFDAKYRPTFAVGRQSKSSLEANSGVLYYPMQTTTGPNQTVIVNDQTKQPAQVWTHDGLYVGGFFDHRAADDLDDGFYQVHGDDNQGATVVTAKNGRTYWLMPYQGHNRLYEISGWNDWQRQSGEISLPNSIGAQSKGGTGLTAKYVQGRQIVLETIEDPIYHEPFGAERHAEKVAPHYKAIWSGFITPALSDRFQFSSLLGNGEQIAVWIDGQVIHANGFEDIVTLPVDLSAGCRQRIRIEYINPDGRAELKLLWSSRVLDPTRLPITALYPDSID